MDPHNVVLTPRSPQLIVFEERRCGKICTLVHHMYYKFSVDENRMHKNMLIDPKSLCANFKLKTMWLSVVLITYIAVINYLLQFRHR